MTVQTLFRWIAWLLVLAVALFTLSPIEMRPATQSPADVERFLAFILIGGAFSLGYPKQRIFILLFVVALVGLLEAAQELVPGRHGRLHDGMIKALGALLGGAAAILADQCLKLQRRRAKSQSKAA